MFKQWKRSSNLIRDWVSSWDEIWDEKMKKWNVETNGLIDGDESRGTHHTWWKGGRRGWFKIQESRKGKSTNHTEMRRVSVAMMGGKWEWMKMLKDIQISPLSDLTSNGGDVPLPIHFHVTWLFVIAKGTIKELIERHHGLHLRRGLTLTSASTHL